MTPLKAIGFDCFHTLINLQMGGLPRMQTPTGEVATSAPVLHKALAKAGHSVDVQKIHDALVLSWKKAEAIRADTHNEVSSPERMGWLFEAINIPYNAALVQDISEAHAQSLLKAMELIPYALEVVNSLAARIPLFMISNFDRSKTVLDAMRHFGLIAYFDTIVVSDAQGVVKPHLSIFEKATNDMNVKPENVLFVGDQPATDMIGAKNAGMHAAWYPHRPQQQDQLPANVLILKDLRSLLNLI